MWQRNTDEHADIYANCHCYKHSNADKYTDRFTDATARVARRSSVNCEVRSPALLTSVVLVAVRDLLC